jgi:hypothetical protein
MPVARVVHPRPWMLTSYAVKLRSEGDGSGYPIHARPSHKPKAKP